jgi:hypothetical protein
MIAYSFGSIQWEQALQTVSRAFTLSNNPAIGLSPDENRALIPVAGGVTDLWIADLNRKTFSRFTFDGSTSGLWSPDGRNVLWAARAAALRALPMAPAKMNSFSRIRNVSLATLKIGPAMERALPFRRTTPSLNLTFGL